MKKLLIALLLVLSCVLLFACVQSGPVTDTTAPSEEGTPNATDAPTEAPTETEPDQINIDKGGCGSAIGFSALALPALGGVLLIKRRED